MEKSSKSTRQCIFSTGCLLLTLLLIANIQGGHCTVSIESSPSWGYYRGNSTTITVADHDQEFLMHSQFGDLLAANGDNSLSYAAARLQKPICSQPVYGNCIESRGYPVQRRTCPPTNFCNHSN